MWPVQCPGCVSTLDAGTIADAVAAAKADFVAGAWRRRLTDRFSSQR
jgi:hypothetical protein